MAFKWFVYISLLFELLLTGLAGTLDSITIVEFWSRVWEAGGGWFLLGLHAVFAFAIYDMAKKWMPFTSIAEEVFRTLELPSPGNIDLVKSSKGRHTPEDAFEYGAMFFRY